MKPVPQPIVLVLIAVFVVLGYFAGLNHQERNQNELDLNNDEVVNLTDFSIALARANDIAEEMRNQNPKANVIEDVYPPVPLPYEPTLKQ